VRQSTPTGYMFLMVITSKLQESAILEVSSSNPAIPNRKLTGTIQARLKKSLTVVTGQEIAVSANIRVQSKDLLTLGEVLRCVPEPDATWTVDIVIKHTMFIV
jgi:hypothetical protein